MTLYYQDDCVTLYHGDSLEILPTLDIEATALLTDPPYFKVKDEPWDNQWKKPEQFLAWLGDFLDLAKPLVAANGSVWVFASPKMSARVELLVGERFNVLNNIRWWKAGGDNLRRVSMPTMRSFVSIWESIIFAEKYADQYDDMAKALHREVFAPIGRYLQTERERAGVPRSELVALFPSASGGATGAVFNWEVGLNTPSREQYESMREYLNRAGGAYMRREYEDLRREYEYLRRPFRVESRPLSEDIWRFHHVEKYPGKHPCEKPQDMLRHMIQCSTREGDTVLDPFAGSGSTLIAARSLGRKAVGIEMSEKYCEQIVKTLTTQPEQMAFEFTA